MAFSIKRIIINIVNSGENTKKPRLELFASLLKRFDRDGEKQFVRQYTGEDTWVASASYFPFVSAAVILLRKNNSEFVSFHARQALVVLVISLFAFVVVPSIAKLIVGIAAYTILVFGAFRALQGRKWYLPVVTEVANTIDL